MQGMLFLVQRLQTSLIRCDNLFLYRNRCLIVALELGNKRASALRHGAQLDRVIAKLCHRALGYDLLLAAVERIHAHDRLIEQFDVRSGQGAVTIARSMSGGNQQKAIIAREVDRDKPLIIAVQPTRGLDVGAIEYIHKQLVAQRDAGKAVLLVSLELDEVMSLSDRILVMYEGQIVGELDPKQTTVQELGLYMSGAKRSGKDGESA